MLPENLIVNHILVSKPERIIYLSCQDAEDRIQLYCIYDRRQVKTYDNQGGWYTLNQIISGKILKLADEYIDKSPTYSARNISMEFVN